MHVVVHLHPNCQPTPMLASATGVSLQELQHLAAASMPTAARLRRDHPLRGMKMHRARASLPGRRQLLAQGGARARRTLMQALTALGHVRIQPPLSTWLGTKLLNVTAATLQDRARAEGRIGLTTEAPNARMNLKPAGQPVTARWRGVRVRRHSTQVPCKH